MQHTIITEFRLYVPCYYNQVFNLEPRGKKHYFYLFYWTGKNGERLLSHPLSERIQL